ncbi:MAG: DUF5677 domain-containing protein [Gemmatimonadales bacterium]
MTAQVSAADAKRLLGRTIRFARRAEDVILGIHQDKPLRRVCYGTLVRSRRLAEAAHALAPHWTYEGRVLFRTMIELYFNYSWIRLGPQRRANRFIKFVYLERLRIAAQYPDDEPSGDYAEAVRKLRQHRSQLRYLFRIQDKHGKRRWATDWADVTSSKLGSRKCSVPHLSPPIRSTISHTGCTDG